MKHKKQRKQSRQIIWRETPNDLNTLYTNVEQIAMTLPANSTIKTFTKFEQIAIEVAINVTKLSFN